MTIPTLNDGTDHAPALRCFLSMGNLIKLPTWSSFPTDADDELKFRTIKQAGFDGVQGHQPNPWIEKLGLGFAAGGRLNAPGEAGPAIARWRDMGCACATVHAGWGMEDDNTVDALVEDIINASVKSGFPVYIETHRATLTQDMWRTVKLTERQPGVRFNGDFSHWYTGQEMPYGDMAAKLDFLEPVFERVRFMHGRIGSSGCMQVDIADGTDDAPQLIGTRNFIADFRTIWTRAMAGFLRNAGPGDYLVFAPELLGPGSYYAQQAPDATGAMDELGDRWQQARLYCDIARDCFAAAQRQAG